LDEVDPVCGRRNAKAEVPHKTLFTQAIRRFDAVNGINPAESIKELMT